MAEEEDKDKGTVCVTGGTGYIASWLVMRLLQEGYTVHATIRSPPEEDGKKDVSYITNLPFASKKLKLFTADLNQPESFAAAIEGSTAVFHVAHPTEQTGESHETVTNRAVNGLLGILKACVESKTVKRVVYTSSLSSVAYIGNEERGRQLDEDTWSDVEICKRIGENNKLSVAYLVSKIVTEKTALDFAERNGLDLVSLVLPLVVGPFICPYVPSSVYIFLNMILGKKEGYIGLFASYNMVHVDDVASAHIYFLECKNDEVRGRYICSSVDVAIDEMFEYFSAKYPQYELPSQELVKEVRAYDRPIVSSKKLLNCGFKFKRGLDEMFDGAIRCCKEKGFL